MNRLERAASRVTLQRFLNIPRRRVFAELLLDHPKWMLCFGADMRFGGLDQIIQSALWRLWQHSTLPGSHGNAEADPPALHFVSLLDSLPPDQEPKGDRPAPARRHGGAGSRIPGP